MQESDGHLQRRHGASLCGAFSFVASAVGEDAGGGMSAAVHGGECFRRQCFPCPAETMNAAVQVEENCRDFVFRGRDRHFGVFLPVFGVFRGETRGGVRGAVEKIGENGKIRSFRAFFTTLRFC